MFDFFLSLHFIIFVKIYSDMNDENNKTIENKNNTSDKRLDIGRGCTFDNHDGETVATPCEGCYKLHTTDWLADYPDVTPSDIFEVRFKNTHRSYYKNVYNLPLKVGDIVAVEASPGHDIGIVSISGDMVAKQMRRVGFNPQNGEFKKIYRKAKPYDIERWQEAIALEHETMIRSRQIAADMKLNMKIGDVEYQGDKIKAIFYYIADERVDFRELIKVFAEQFHIKVEMKQIGARQEAGRIGGLGSCGRQLCCASWISNFVSVTTNAAHMQDLSLNPQKLAGQCSKLKCCLIYELDNYIDARREFPKINAPLQTLDADYYLVKTDILGRTMSFSTTPHSMVNMITLPISRVKEVMRMNAAGKKPDRLDSEEEMRQSRQEPGFVNVIGEDSITRFDNAKKKRKKKKKKGDGVQQSQGGNLRSEKQHGAEKREDGQQAQPQSGEPQGEGRHDDKQGEARQQNGRRGDKRQNRNNRERGDKEQRRRQEPNGEHKVRTEEAKTERTAEHESVKTTKPERTKPDGARAEGTKQEDVRTEGGERNRKRRPQRNRRNGQEGGEQKEPKNDE